MAAMSRNAAFAGAATLLVGAVVLTGFWILGVPSEQRAAAADRQRVRDLKAIAQSIHAMWEGSSPERRELPASLPQVRPAPNLQRLFFRDPVTEELYEYRRLEGAKYELCATFATDDRPEVSGARPGAAAFWSHPKGQQCYVLAASEKPQ